jgi:glycosyltransferase involved in cell wall biosynthesis
VKIGLVNKHFQLGGIETVVHQLRLGLPRKGFATELWVSEYRSLPVGKKRIHPLYPVPFNRLQRSRLAGVTESLFPRRRWTERKFRQIRRSDCQVVHIHGFDGTYADLEYLVELAESKPTVITLHSTWFFTGGCGQPSGCTKFQDSCGNCPLLASERAGGDDTAIELDKKRRLLATAPVQFITPALHLGNRARRSTVGKSWQITHIPNGVAPELFVGTRKKDPQARSKLGLAPERTIVLAMNRDFRDPVKGGALMEDALMKLPAENVQIALAGAYAEEVAARLPGRLRPVSFGYVSNAQTRRDLFEVADVFLFSSVDETFPCVILEAMSAECCVVSTPLDALREQVQDGKSGLLATGFTGEALAERLEKACREPDLVKEIGQAARREVLEKFSEEIMITRHMECYRRLAR